MHYILLVVFILDKNSSSVVESTHTSKETDNWGLKFLNSYETEWDMINTVLFKKKPHINGGAPSHRNGKSK